MVRLGYNKRLPTTEYLGAKEACDTDSGFSDGYSSGESISRRPMGHRLRTGTNGVDTKLSNKHGAMHGSGSQRGTAISTISTAWMLMSSRLYNLAAN